MEPNNSSLALLDLIQQPGFCVQEGIITHVNPSAQRIGIIAGTPVTEQMATGKDEYADFSDGSMYLTIAAGDAHFGASVTRMDSCDIFLLAEDIEKVQLQTVSLAAQALREPMSGVLSTATQLEAESKAARREIAALQRGLYRMLRLISNMSDAARYAKWKHPILETCNITAFFKELFESIDSRIAQTGHTLHYTGINQSIFCLANTEQLERAVYNMVSNAIKFSPENSAVYVRLTRNKNKLYLTVENSGDGIPQEQWRNVFFGFQREPDIAEGRHGIGLGMVLIRAAATTHGGTVLVEQPENGGSCVTLSITLRQKEDLQVNNPVLRVDYLGELDHSLIEFSDLLPPSAYE